ncbi:MAG: hypothetical protein WBC97_06975 [Gemmatimonadales bacterium]
MLLIREIFHCRPGKVRSLVEKFQAMSKLGQKSGMPPMRILTDMAGARYWTLVAEMEVPSLGEFEKMMSGAGQSAEEGKEMEKIMKDYHDLVESGHREVFKIEG